LQANKTRKIEVTWKKAEIDVMPVTRPAPGESPASPMPTSAPRHVHGFLLARERRGDERHLHALARDHQQHQREHADPWPARALEPRLMRPPISPRIFFACFSM